MPGRVRGFLEMFRSVLNAQNGISEELQLEVRCGGWWTIWEGLFPEMICSDINKANGRWFSYLILPKNEDMLPIYSPVKKSL